jgi:integrase
VTEYAQRFIDRASDHARETTRYSYESTLRLHILPRIGLMRLSDLTGDAVKALYASLRKTVSASMSARVHVVLRAVLNLAREEGFIASSPLEGMRKFVPRHKPPRVESLSEAQVRKLLKSAKGHRLEALFVLAITTGLRQGELFALRWSDIDLQRRTLYVQRAAQEVNGDIAFVEPKTDQSRRRVQLSTTALDALKRRRELAKGEDHSSDLAFPSEHGHVLRKSNFIRREWDPIREAAGTPGARFHDLRHTAASLLLIEGVHPKVVSEMLGHASVRLTLDTYSHLIPTMQAEAARAFDRLLRQPRKRA